MVKERFLSLTLGLFLVEEVLKTSQTARKGSQDLTAGSNFLSCRGDPTNTEEAEGFEELFFRQQKGRISYVTGWIYTFHVKCLGPSVGNCSGEGAESESLLMLPANYNSPEEESEELPPIYG